MESAQWKRYVEVIDTIVEQGFNVMVNYMMNYFLDETEDDTKLAPLFEVRMHLVVSRFYVSIIIEYASQPLGLHESNHPEFSELLQNDKFQQKSRVA